MIRLELACKKVLFDTGGNRALCNYLSVPVVHHVGRPAFEAQIRQHICDELVNAVDVTNTLNRGRNC